MFYSHNEDPHNIHTETLGGNILSYTVDVLGRATYQFHVRAATIKPGPNATMSVTVNDYGRYRSENIMIKRPVLIYLNSNIAPLLRGIKRKKLIIHPSTSM